MSEHLGRPPARPIGNGDANRQPNAEVTEDTLILVADLESLTGDEVLPEGAKGIVADLGVGSEMDIAVCAKEAATPDVDEDEILGTTSFAVDGGSIDVPAETIVDGIVAENGDLPRSLEKVLHDETEEGASDTNVVGEASVDRVSPAGSDEQTRALEGGTEPVFDFAAETCSTEQAYAPAVNLVAEPEAEPAAPSEAQPDVEGLAGLLRDLVLAKESTIAADEGDADMAAPIPLPGIGGNSAEEPVPPKASAHLVLTFSGPEAPVAHIGNDTLAEESLLEPSTDGQVNMVARVAMATSDALSTATGEPLPVVSVEGTSVAGTGRPIIIEASEDELAFVASLEAPTSSEPTREEAGTLTEEPFRGSIIDDAPAKDERERGDSVVVNPSSVLVEDSAPVLSVFDNGSADMVDESLVVDVASVVAEHPAVTTMEPQEGVEISAMADGQPVSDQEVYPPGLEGKIVDERVPLAAGDGEVAVIEASFVETPMDVVAPGAVEVSTPLNMEEPSSPSAGDEWVHQVAEVKTMAAPATIVTGNSESDQAVDGSAGISTEERGVSRVEEIVEPVEHPGAETTENMPAAVGQPESVARDEVIPDRETGVAVAEPGVLSEMDIPGYVEAATPELDEVGVAAAVVVAVDDGSMDATTEAIVNGVVGADGETPPSYSGSEESSPDMDAVNEATADGVPPEEPEEQSSARDAEIETAADLGVDQMGDRAIDQASEPTIGVVSVTEPEPEPELELEPESESESESESEPKSKPEPEPKPATMQVPEQGSSGVAGLPEKRTIIEKRPTAMEEEPDNKGGVGMMNEPRPVTEIAQDDAEDPVCLKIPDHPIATAPEKNMSVVGIGRNTLTEESMLDPSAEAEVDAVASVEVEVPDASSTAKGGCMSEASGEVPAIAESEQSIVEATEDEPAVVTNLEVTASEDPAQENATSAAEEPFSGMDVDDNLTEGQGEGGASVAVTPDSVPGDESDLADSVVVDEKSADVVNEYVVLHVAPVVREHANASTVEEGIERPTMAAEQPAPDQEVAPRGVEGVAVDEGVHLTSDDGELAVDSLDEPTENVVALIADETIPSTQAEVPRSVSPKDEPASEVSKVEAIKEPAVVAMVASSSDPAVDAPMGVFVEEPGVAVANVTCDAPEPMDLGEEPKSVDAVEAPDVVVNEGDGELTVEMEAEPFDQLSGVEEKDNALAVVAKLESTTRDEALIPEEVTRVTADPGADSEVNLPVRVEAAPELDEGEVEEAAFVAVDEGSANVAAEAIAHDVDVADGENPPACLVGVLDEAGEGAPDTKVVDEASVDGFPPVETGEESSTLEVGTEIVADFVVVQVEDGAIEQASEPAINTMTEPAPQLERETEPHPESDPAAAQAGEGVGGVGMDNLPDLPTDTVIVKGAYITEDERKLTGGADITKLVSMELTAQGNGEETMCSTSPRDHLGLTVPDPEAPMAGTTNNTPTEGWMLEQLTRGSVDTVASIATAISDALSTVEGDLVSDVSAAGVSAVAGIEHPTTEATESDPEVAGRLNVPASEEPTCKETVGVGEEDKLAVTVDEAPYEDGVGGRDAPAVDMPASVLDGDSAPVIPVVVDGGSADVVDESLVLDFAPVVEEPTVSTTTESLSREDVETSAMEHPSLNQAVDHPGLEGTTAEESVPQDSDKGEVTMVDCPLAEMAVGATTPPGASTPPEDKKSTPLQVEVSPSASVQDEQMSKEAGSESVQEPILSDIVAGASAPAVAASMDVSTEETGVAVAEVDIGGPEAKKPMDEPSMSTVLDASAEELGWGAPADDLVAVVNEGDIEPTVEVEGATKPVEQACVMTTEDTPAVVISDSNSATWHEFPPDGATMAAEEKPVAHAAMDTPISAEPQASKVEETDVAAAAPVALDDGWVDVSAEPVADSAAGVDEETPSSSDTEGFGADEQTAPGSKVVAEATADEILPVAAADAAEIVPVAAEDLASAAFKTDVEVTAPRMVDRVRHGGIDRLSAHDIDPALEREPDPKTASEETEEPEIKGLTSPPVDVVIEKDGTDIPESAPMVVTTRDDHEAPACSVAPNPGTTLPEREATTVDRAGNNTLIEESMLEPSMDRPIDTVASITAEVSDAISTVTGARLPVEGSNDVPTVPELVLDKSVPGVTVVDVVEQPIAVATVATEPAPADDDSVGMNTKASSVVVVAENDAEADEGVGGGPGGQPRILATTDASTEESVVAVTMEALAAVVDEIDAEETMEVEAAGVEPVEEPRAEAKEDIPADVASVNVEVGDESNVEGVTNVVEDPTASGDRSIPVSPETHTSEDNGDDITSAVSAPPVNVDQSSDVFVEPVVDDAVGENEKNTPSYTDVLYDAADEGAPNASVVNEVGMAGILPAALDAGVDLALLLKPRLKTETAAEEKAVVETDSDVLVGAGPASTEDEDLVPAPVVEEGAETVEAVSASATTGESDADRGCLVASGEPMSVLSEAGVGPDACVGHSDPADESSLATFTVAACDSISTVVEGAVLDSCVEDSAHTEEPTVKATSGGSIDMATVVTASASDAVSTVVDELLLETFGETPVTEAMGDESTAFANADSPIIADPTREGASIATEESQKGLDSAPEEKSTRAVSAASIVEIRDAADAESIDGEAVLVATAEDDCKASEAVVEQLLLDDSPVAGDVSPRSGAMPDVETPTVELMDLDVEEHLPEVSLGAQAVVAEGGRVELEVQDKPEPVDQDQASTSDTAEDKPATLNELPPDRATSVSVVEEPIAGAGNDVPVSVEALTSEIDGGEVKVDYNVAAGDGLDDTMAESKTDVGVGVGEGVGALNAKEDTPAAHILGGMDAVDGVLPASNYGEEEPGLEKSLEPEAATEVTSAPKPAIKSELESAPKATVKGPNRAVGVVPERALDVVTEKKAPIDGSLFATVDVRALAGAVGTGSVSGDSAVATFGRSLGITSEADASSEDGKRLDGPVAMLRRKFEQRRSSADGDKTHERPTGTATKIPAPPVVEEKAVSNEGQGRPPPMHEKPKSSFARAAVKEDDEIASHVGSTPATTKEATRTVDSKNSVRVAARKARTRGSDGGFVAAAVKRLSSQSRDDEQAPDGSDHHQPNGETISGGGAKGAVVHGGEGAFVVASVDSKSVPHLRDKGQSHDNSGRPLLYHGISRYLDSELIFTSPSEIEPPEDMESVDVSAVEKSPKPITATADALTMTTVQESKAPVVTQRESIEDGGVEHIDGVDEDATPSGLSAAAVEAEWVTENEESGLVVSSQKLSESSIHDSIGEQEADPFFDTGRDENEDSTGSNARDSYARDPDDDLPQAACPIPKFCITS